MNTMFRKKTTVDILKELYAEGTPPRSMLAIKHHLSNVYEVTPIALPGIILGSWVLLKMIEQEFS